MLIIKKLFLNIRLKIIKRIIILSICLILTLSVAVSGFNPINDNNFSIQDTSEVNEMETIELGSIMIGQFTEEQKSSGNFILYFYVNIDHPGIYEIALTMPEYIDDVSASLMTTISLDTSYQRFAIPQVLASSYFSQFDEESTQEEIFSIPDIIDISNPIGLSLTIYSSSSDSLDFQYQILISQKTTSSGTSGSYMFTNEEDERYYSAREYFIFDPTDLGISEEGFYNFTTTFSIDNITTSGEYTSEYDYYGDISIRSYNSPKLEFYASNYFDGDYWDKPDDESSSTFLYLDPNEEYIFSIYYSCRINDYVTSLEFKFDFQASSFPIKVLNVEDTVSIPADENTMIKVDIPRGESVRITSDKNTNFSLRIFTESNYIFYKNYYQRKDNDGTNNYDISSRIFSHILLTRQEFNQTFVNLSPFNSMIEYSELILGGVVSTYSSNYRNYDYMYFREQKTADLITSNIGSNKHLYFSVDSEVNLTFTSTTNTIPDIPSDETSVNLITNEPLKMYKMEARAEDFFTLKMEKEFSVTEPSMIEEDPLFIEFYTNSYLENMNTFYIPGSLPISMYNAGSTNFALEDGTGILICAAGYSIYSSANLNSSDIQYPTVKPDDIKPMLNNAEITFKLIKSTVPDLVDLIDVELNLTQPIQLYAFPVSSGDVFNFTMECQPFQSVTYIFFFDKNGDNPFHSINVFSNLVGMSGTLVGKKSTTAYIVVAGYGPVKIHLKKIGSGGEVGTSDGMISPGFELLILLIVIPVIIKIRNRSKK